MKAEVADAYEIGALVGAMSFRKSPGVEEVAGSVLMGGVLVNLMDFPVFWVASVVVMVGVMFI